MPPRRFIGQVLLDFLLANGYERCADPPGPPTGTVLVSRDCSDSAADLLVVSVTVVMGSAYAETILNRARIASDEFWDYLDTHA